MGTAADKDFSIIVNQYANMVFGVACHILHDYHLAEDAAQEAFLQAYLHLDELRDNQRFGSWLYTIAKRVSIRYSARMGMKDTFVSDTVAFGDRQDSTVEEVVLRSEQRQRVWQALGTLSEANRLTTILFYLSGHSAGDVSRFLGVSVDAVESRLRRARRHLRQELMDMVAENLEGERLGSNFENKVRKLVDKVKECQAEGKIKDALDNIRQAVAMKPNDLELRKTLAHVLSTAGNNEHDKGLLEEAIIEYKLIVDKNPAENHGLGYTYMHMDRVDDAIACFEKLSSPDIDGRSALAQALRRKGQYEDASRTSQAVAANAFHELILSLSGLADDAVHLGDRDAAYRYVRMLVGVVEASGRERNGLFLGWHGYLRLAKLQLDDGLVNEALDSLEQARSMALLATTKPEPVLWNSLSWSHWQSGEGTNLDWFLGRLAGKRFALLKDHPRYEEIIGVTKENIAELRAGSNL